MRFHSIYFHSYVDTCKYDSNDVNISCKHVKSSLEYCTTKAEPLRIDSNIFNSIEMQEDIKEKCVNLHKESESVIPFVQRISQTMFVVRCDVTLNFPTGLLHVVCSGDAKEAR